MIIADIVFGLLILGFLVYELYTVFNKTDGDTFTERVRYHLRTDTPGGKWVFVVITILFVAWWIPHILL